MAGEAELTFRSDYFSGRRKISADFQRVPFLSHFFATRMDALDGDEGYLFTAKGEE